MFLKRFRRVGKNEILFLVYLDEYRYNMNENGFKILQKRRKTL